MRGFLYARFWDRWIANGMPAATVTELRERLFVLEDWIGILHKHAKVYEQQAASLLIQDSISDAENLYRLAGMHYSLMQWIFPATGVEKRTWYARCKDMHRKADALSEDEIIHVAIPVEGNDCYGRIRAPDRPRGCVILLNPVECSKEELFDYEGSFTKMGFVTVCFDGPGQGETYVSGQYKATEHRWELFLNRLIEFAAFRYPDLDLYLFGNSSGATWGLVGSSHPKVCRTVSVSPIIENHSRIPDYVIERLAHIIDCNEQEQRLLPKLKNLERMGPILFVHGKKDVIVKDEDLRELYDNLPNMKRLIEYVDEGHCCIHRRSGILKFAVEWYLEA